MRFCFANGQRFLTHGRKQVSPNKTNSQKPFGKGAKSCDIEHERGNNGYKILYFGNTHTEYGVGIAIPEGFRDAIKEIERFDERLMKLTIISVDRTIDLFTAYSPQIS